MMRDHVLSCSKDALEICSRHPPEHKEVESTFDIRKSTCSGM